MRHFYGIVEDRNDPLQIGRVRVRIHGIHTDDKNYISTPDLPWCQVILPTTSASISGLGTQHGLVEGSTVFGYFRDNYMQDPIVLGSLAGIPASGFKKTVRDELLSRSVEKGFNDPRRLTAADYDGTNDGKNPPQDSTRTFGLEKGLDTAPKSPKTLDIKYDATGSKIEEQEITEDMLPFYPLYTDESDVSSLARGSVLDHKLSENVEGFLDSVAEPVYPYNKVYISESGHAIELDDTVGKERINIHHRSGTFHEIHPDGSEVSRIVNDHYQVVCKDDKIFIAGNADLTVEKGNVTINVNTGNVNMNVVQGNVDAQIGGTLNADVTGNTTFTSPETTMTTNLTVDGTVHITGKQTNDSTIHAVGDISTDAGNSPTLATHKHETIITSGSSAGKYTSKKGK